MKRPWLPSYCQSAEADAEQRSNEGGGRERERSQAQQIEGDSERERDEERGREKKREGEKRDKIRVNQEEKTCSANETLQIRREVSVWRTSGPVYKSAYLQGAFPPTSTAEKNAIKIYKYIIYKIHVYVYKNKIMLKSNWEHKCSLSEASKATLTTSRATSSLQRTSKTDNCSP